MDEAMERGACGGTDYKTIAGERHSLSGNQCAGAMERCCGAGGCAGTLRIVFEYVVWTTEDECMCVLWEAAGRDQNYGWGEYVAHWVPGA